MVDDWVIKTMYATKRRRKNPKSVKPIGVGSRHEQNTKSNPSKRHRERLNSELEHLASLLPFEQNVIVKLDKLSILRLAVSYLRMKCYFQTCSYDRLLSENRLVSHLYHCPFDLSRSEGEACLQALDGFIFIISCDGEVFSVSKTVEHYLGFHQADILHQSVLELIHSEDREEFRRQLLWRSHLPVELQNYSLQDLMTRDLSHHLQRRFTIRFRCLLDNTSGFITLELCGRLQFLHGQTRGKQSSGSFSGPHSGQSGGSRGPGRGNHIATADVAAHGSSGTASAYSIPPVGLFIVCSPLGPLPSLSGAQRDMTFKTKHKLDLTVTTIDSRTRLIFNYTDADLQCFKVYDLVHPEDLQYVAQGHREVFKAGSIGLLVHRWLTKSCQWIWLQSRVKLMMKNGKQDHIIAIHRQLSHQEGMELLIRRSDEYKLPFPLLEPETLLNEDGVTGNGRSAVECYPSEFTGSNTITDFDTSNLICTQLHGNLGKLEAGNLDMSLALNNEYAGVEECVTRPTMDDYKKDGNSRFAFADRRLNTTTPLSTSRPTAYPQAGAQTATTRSTKTHGKSAQGRKRTKALKQDQTNLLHNNTIGLSIPSGYADIPTPFGLPASYSNLIHPDYRHLHQSYSLPAQQQQQQQQQHQLQLQHHPEHQHNHQHQHTPSIQHSHPNQISYSPRQTFFNQSPFTPQQVNNFGPFEHNSRVFGHSASSINLATDFNAYPTDGGEAGSYHQQQQHPLSWRTTTDSSYHHNNNTDGGGGGNPQSLFHSLQPHDQPLIDGSSRRRPVASIGESTDSLSYPTAVAAVAAYDAYAMAAAAMVAAAGGCSEQQAGESMSQSYPFVSRTSTDQQIANYASRENNGLSHPYTSDAHGHLSRSLSIRRGDDNYPMRYMLNNTEKPSWTSADEFNASTKIEDVQRVIQTNLFNENLVRVGTSPFDQTPPPSEVILAAAAVPPLPVTPALLQCQIIQPSNDHMTSSPSGTNRSHSTPLHEMAVSKEEERFPLRPPTIHHQFPSSVTMINGMDAAVGAAAASDGSVWSDPADQGSLSNQPGGNGNKSTSSMCSASATESNSSGSPSPLSDRHEIRTEEERVRTVIVHNNNTTTKETMLDVGKTGGHLEHAPLAGPNMDWASTEGDNGSHSLITDRESSMGRMSTQSADVHSGSSRSSIQSFDSYKGLHGTDLASKETHLSCNIPNRITAMSSSTGNSWWLM